MTFDESQVDCQIPCLQLVAEGKADMPPASFRRRVKLAIRRRLSPGRERALKTYTNGLMNRFAALTSRSGKPAAPQTRAATPHLKAGDSVRVRSREEVEATLNHWKQLKGCTFMNEMWTYCGTTQRVLRLLERFVDERDLSVKTAKGIVLLEGVMCAGTADFGRCDRSCFYFWREEWLEKIV
jgi:hypothetical protein